MPQDIVHRTTTSPREQAFDVTTPLSSRLLFRRPRYLGGSGFLHHLPFLFWLTDTIRPRSVVQLGALDPVPYFALCQAMDKLDLESRCAGICLDGPVPEATERYNADTYGEFSRLRAAEVETAANGIADKSVDLLLVDGVPDEALIGALMRTWPRRLSSRAVVALHGTRGEDYLSGPALEFLDNIRATYPTVTLEGGTGLTLVLYGAARNDRLLRLAELQPGHAGFSEAHMVFRRLGDASHFEWESRRAGGAEKAEAGKAKAAEARLHELEAGLKEMSGAFEERARQASAAQVKLFRLETEIAEARAQAEAAETGRKELETRVATLEARAGAAEKQVEEARLAEQRVRREHEAELERGQAEAGRQGAELARERELRQALEQELSARDERIAALEKDGGAGAQWQDRLAALAGQMSLLTRELEKEQELRLLQGEDLSDARARAREAEAALATVQAHAETMEQLNQDLMNSTFWKMTGPARKVVNTLRGN